MSDREQETNRRDLILLTIDDLVSNFLYYDRKEDPELPRAAIDAAVRENEITVAEIVERFRSALTEGLA